MPQKHTLQMTVAALMAAVIAVLTLIPIPFSFLGVPMTLQTFAVALCGFLLGWKYAIGSVSLYLLLGGIGAPVFAGFQGGFTKFIGSTGGFLYGFVFLAFFCGLSREFRLRSHRRIYGIPFGIIGLLLCYLTGSIQLSALNNSLTFWGAVTSVCLPFLPKDILSIAAAFFLAMLLRRRIPVLSFIAQK